MISTNDGMLLGEIRRGRQTIWVLADPDIIANHGLGERGEANAILAVEHVQASAGGSRQSRVRGRAYTATAQSRKARVAMFQFPFYIVTRHGRDGDAPAAVGDDGPFRRAGKATVPLAAGKQGLVDNVARLMDFAGHHKLMVHRYVEATIRDTARQMHAPKGLVRRRTGGMADSASAARAVSRRIAPPFFNRANDLIRDNAQRSPGVREPSPGASIAGSRRSSMDVRSIHAVADAVRGEVRKAVVGQDEVIDLMLTSLLVGGHVLLEGVPGTAKTCSRAPSPPRWRCNSAASSSRPT